MWKKLPYKGCIYFAIGLNLISIAVILALKGVLPPVVPLFYGLPGGIEQLTPSLGLLIGPVTGLVITALNIFLSSLTGDAFLKKTLIISSAFITLLVTIAVIKIIFLVGFF